MVKFKIREYLFAIKPFEYFKLTRNVTFEELEFKMEKEEILKSPDGLMLKDKISLKFTRM